MAELIDNCLECCLCDDADTDCMSAMRIYCIERVYGERMELTGD